MDVGKTKLGRPSEFQSPMVHKDCSIWVQRIVLPLVQASMVQICCADCASAAIDTFTSRELFSLAQKEKKWRFFDE